MRWIKVRRVRVGSRCAHLGLDHPELGEVAARPAALSTEGRVEGVNPGHAGTNSVTDTDEDCHVPGYPVTDGLKVHLAGDGEVDGQVPVAGLLLRQAGGRRHREHLAWAR